MFKVIEIIGISKIKFSNFSSTEKVNETMPRNRYQAILECLHFNDNSNFDLKRSCAREVLQNSSVYIVFSNQILKFIHTKKEHFNR